MLIKRLNQNRLKIFTYLVLGTVGITGYFFIFPMLGGLVFFWAILYTIVIWKGLDKKLSQRERNLWFIIVILYPILEAIIKYYLTFNVIPYSWSWINRIEHILSAIAIQIMFLPFFISTLKKLNLVERFLLLLCFTVFIGNLNEFQEYLIRLKLGLTGKNYFSAYYWDTIYDMAMNVLGGVIGFGVITSLDLKRIVKDRSQ